MRLRHFYPLIGFVVPTVVIGYSFVIPQRLTEAGRWGRDAR